MFDRIQDALHCVLSESLGVSEPILATQNLIHFHWFGYDYAMDCQSPMWVNLGVTLHDASVPGGNPLHRMRMADVPRDEILKRLASFNGAFAHLRFALVRQNRMDQRSVR